MKTKASYSFEGTTHSVTVLDRKCVCTCRCIVDDVSTTAHYNRSSTLATKDIAYRMCYMMYIVHACRSWKNDSISRVDMEEGSLVTVHLQVQHT